MDRPRRKLPPLNALRAFEASARRLSFRAAAEELSVTQGAVAQQVRVLEAHLGMRLFQRLPRGLALTPAAASYQGELARALEQIETATARLLARPARVTISVTPSFATRVLVPRLAAFQAALPGIELSTIATEALSDFERDDVDLMVRLARPPFAPNVEAVCLFRDDLIAVASPRLVDGQALPLSLAQLQALPLLHDAHGRWRLFLGLAVNPAGTVFNQTTLALDAAVAGQGVALTCPAFVARELAAGSLVQVAEQVWRADTGYYLLRQRRAVARAAVDAAWAWWAGGHATASP